MSLFIKNIKKLVGVRREVPVSPLKGKEMESLPCLDNAWLLTEGDRIKDFGAMDNTAPETLASLESAADEVIDAAGRMVFPSYCDSHTHLVYAGSREMEFMDKLRGLSYQEIARRGGGILNSVELLHNTSEDELLRQTLERAGEIISLGTGAVEIKSGYGLTVEDEIKMLRVARRVGEETPLKVSTTFLGAHAVPARYKGDRSGYVTEIVRDMIPAVAAEGLADYVDIFVEEGFFTVEDACRIFEAAAGYGMRPKVHANQMSFSGGVQVGVRYGAASVDHLEFTGPEEFKALQDSGTIATLLPGATFFLDMDYPNAKQMLEYDLPLAIASNYNPGSCPSGDMKFMMALAMIKMRLTPETVLNAATLNGAFAMDAGADYGSITVGKKASFFITKRIPSYEFIPYSFTSQLIGDVVLNGKIYRQ
ncbi:MAG TPA: imidazolonepropionase [Candidatus Coprenecus stercoravium]|uniref:Imidazolonepropionase n=1 Tax=Candidatus Coprenecus stercoravium TaxID=2840735 RepID=A0A9D2GQJ1_9BACT|nr:imidazolonepropionase [Candidatus Coprenecus stercoravium]